MDYEEFLKIVFSEELEPVKKTTPKRTAEDIMAELMPLVEADKKRGG